MKIRAYTGKDRKDLTALIQTLQDYVAGLDSLGLNKSGKEFDAPAYARHLLQKVAHGNGLVFVAEQDGNILGGIAGVVEETSPEDQLEIHSETSGRVVELIVSPEHRGKNVGKELMEAMEAFFKERNCAHVRVECFAPNTGAHAFYEKCEYGDRTIEMLKTLD
ncbi:GNAT family N-acetyltransferase [Patescibacteria group bacterium]|nr:GNAT family N-acetyltransferase [Patescibacteria group bacterium]MBU2259692.1 GNAT family N-acetyltransferase [Patescibacteria group bacterium]